MYQLCKATANEKDVAIHLIEQAKAFLKAQGIDQWQKGYPDAACIQNDIACGKGYFLLNEESKIAAYMCIDFDGEPAYDGLKGTWLTAKDACYGVVHRLAIDSACRGKGLASIIFELVQQMCIEKSVGSIRIDTDADNEIMKHLLTKNGFTYCGLIRFDNSNKIAYEKVL